MCYRISIHRQSARIEVSQASSKEFEWEDVIVRTKRDLVLELKKAGMKKTEIDSHFIRLNEQKKRQKQEKVAGAHINRAMRLANKIASRACPPGDAPLIAGQIVEELCRVREKLKTIPICIDRKSKSV